MTAKAASTNVVGASAPRFEDSLDAAMSRLEALLVEERASIVAMDSDAVSLAASEKEALFGIITRTLEADPTRKADVLPRMKGVTEQLRRNGVLLAHARDCLRDALLAFDVYEPVSTLPPGVLPGRFRSNRPNHDGRALPTLRPGRRISVTG